MDNKIYTNIDGIEMRLFSLDTNGSRNLEIAIGTDGSIGRFSEEGGFVRTDLMSGKYEIIVSIPDNQLLQDSKKKRKQISRFLIRAGRVDQIKPAKRNYPQIIGVNNSSMSAVVSVVETKDVDRPGNYIHVIIKKEGGFKIVRISLESQGGCFRMVERILWRSCTLKNGVYRKYKNSAGPFLFDRREVNSIIYPEWPSLDQEMVNRRWLK